MLLLFYLVAGFSYSDQCPANFTAHMSQCKQQFLYDTSLMFHEFNDLVADGNRKDVRQACRYKHTTRNNINSVSLRQLAYETRNNNIFVCSNNK